MHDNIKFMIVSDITDFALTDVYHGYVNAMKALSIPHHVFPFHVFAKLLSSDIAMHVTHSYALIKDLNITHVIFIGAQVLPDFLFRSMYHLKSIVVATEDPHAFDPQKNKIKEIDYYFSNERTVGNSKKYKNSYYCPTAACNQECGKIPREYLPDKYHSDILFLGGLYPGRSKYLEDLIPTVEKYKLNLKICGHIGYLSKNSPLWKYVFDPRTIPHEETIKYYNGAKIVLNPLRDIKWNSKTNKTGNPLNKSRFKGESLNPRAYEVPMCQAFMLLESNRTEAQEIFNKKEVAFFKDSKELVRKVKYYLVGAGKNKRDEMALRAYRKVSENHTYVHRLKLILDTIKSNNPSPA